LSAPVSFDLVALPKPERNYPLPYDYAVEFDSNPNKCTIKWMEKRIIFDDELKSCSLPELMFILNHEFGHAYYTTEKFADLWARNEMIKKGYNPSQIGSAPVTSLSEIQYKRKKFIVNSFLKK
jgi:hypothetical protein